MRKLTDNAGLVNSRLVSFPALAALNAQILAQTIQNNGELVVVTRRASTQGGAPTTHSYYCEVRPLSLSSDSLYVEGISNITTANPQEFIFPASADVQEATDTLNWDGNSWRITNINKTRETGTTTALHVYAVRIG